jgi:hypothetical protein
MRNLIWVAALIGFWSMALDWRDQSEKLRPERERLERLKSREQNAIASVDWGKVSQDALAAQVAWLDRLPEITQPGVFRAEAMESLADLCKQIQAPCQVAAMGETATATSGNDRLLASQATQLGGTSANRQASLPRGSSEAAGIPGLVTSSVKISTSLGPQLMPLLTALEEGPVLRKIDRFTVRSGRAEIIVKVYGMDSGTSLALRTAAQRKSSSGAPTTAR